MANDAQRLQLRLLPCPVGPKVDRNCIAASTIQENQIGEFLYRRRYVSLRRRSSRAWRRRITREGVIAGWRVTRERIVDYVRVR
jgi:hypothetical protein